MSKDDMETECMNELFGKWEEKEEVPYYNHWKPVAIIHPNGEKIRDLTKQEQLEWIKRQKLKDKINE